MLRTDRMINKRWDAILKLIERMSTMIKLFNNKSYDTMTWFLCLFFTMFLTITSCQEDNTGRRVDGSDDEDEEVNNPNPGSTSPPNIVFLLTDDQRFDALSFAGNKVLKTPNIDSLAQNGVYFKNAYVTTSICAMSRASILTGQYARRHDIWDFGESLTEQQFDNTYPALLKKAGYQTGFIGKFGVGNVQQATADKYFDYWGGFNGQGSYNAQYKGEPTHLTEKMGNQAIDFLNQQDSLDSPFLLSISFKSPHVQDGNAQIFIPNEEYAGLYQSDQIETPEAAQEKYFNYFPDEFIANQTT